MRPAAAIWAWYWHVQREDIGRLGVLMFMVPLMGLFLAWVLLDEPIGGRTLAGALLAVLAVARVGWPAHPSPSPD